MIRKDLPYRREVRRENGNRLAGRSIKKREGRKDMSDKVVLFIFCKKNIVVVFLADRERKLACHHGKRVSL